MVPVGQLPATVGQQPGLLTGFRHIRLQQQVSGMCGIELLAWPEMRLVATLEEHAPIPGPGESRSLETPGHASQPWTLPSSQERRPRL